MEATIERGHRRIAVEWRRREIEDRGQTRRGEQFVIGRGCDRTRELHGGALRLFSSRVVERDNIRPIETLFETRKIGAEGNVPAPNNANVDQSPNDSFPIV